MNDIEYGLILANDLVDRVSATRLTKLVSPHVDAIKFGLPTLLNTGVDFVKDIKEETGLPVIADFKIADIGFWNEGTQTWEGTNSKIVRKLCDADVDYIIFHSIVGLASIEECVKTAHQYGAKVLTLPFMTHKGAELFFEHPLDRVYLKKVLSNAGKSELNIAVERCHTVSDAILAIGECYGVDGFIGPANKLAVLRRYRELTDKEIFAPGIGRQTVGQISAYDQARQFFETCGRRSALIIGSAIYESADPKSSALEFSNMRDQIRGEVED